jgi:hypothetical protein
LPATGVDPSATPDTPHVVLGSLTVVSDSEVWARLTVDGAPACSPTPRLLRSGDGGAHWSDVTPTPKTPRSQADHPLWLSGFAALGGHRAIVFAFDHWGEPPEGVPGRLEVLTTSDSGATWRSSTLVAEHWMPSAMSVEAAFVPPRTVDIAVEWEHGMNSMTVSLNRSTDLGASFRALGWSPLSGLPVTVGARQLVVGSGGMTWPSEVYTRAQGGKWAPSKGPFATMADDDEDGKPHFPDILDMGVFGVTGPFILGTGAARTIVLLASGNTDESPLRVLASGDLGQSFHEVTRLEHVVPRCSCANGTSLWLGTDDGLLVTTDRGAHWTRAPLPSEGGIDSIGCRGTTVIALCGDRLFHSADGGRSFTEVRPAGTSPSCAPPPP